MVKKTHILFVLFIFYSIFIIGQTTCRYYTLEDGLSQVIVTDLLQDKEGFVWVGTQDGLNRFDGQKFRVYTNNAADSTSISGNLIYSLFEDHTGIIWVGTFGNGLCIYDKELDNFQRISFGDSDNSHEVITNILEDQNNNIWVSTRSSGLHKFEKIKGHQYKHSNYLHDKALHALHIDRKGIIWTSDINGQLFSINPFETNFEYKKVADIGHLIYTIYEYNNKLYLGTDNGLMVYNIEDGQTSNIMLGDELTTPVRNVFSFEKSNTQSIWIGTDIGLILFDPENNIVLDLIEEDTTSSTGLSDKKVHAIIQLPDNQLLVGTYRYLDLLNFSESYFKNISKDKKGKHLLNDNQIFSLLVHENDKWIGTAGGGLNLIRNGKAYYFTENQYDPFSISGSLIRKICLDKKNQRVWLATSMGLSMLDLKTFSPDNPKFTNINYLKNNLDSVNLSNLKDISIDENGRLWGAGYNNGIFRLNYKSKNDYQLAIYTHEKENPNSLIHNAAHCIVNHHNTVWIGTQNGLSKLSFQEDDYQNPVFENFVHNPQDTTSLSNNWVYDIEIDRENHVWVGTRKGFNLLNTDGTFDSWTTQKQFPNDVVYCIQEDFGDHLWLSTNDGIVSFNKNSRVFAHYGISDGIQNKEFDIHAKFRDEKGIIYFGGIEGITYFNPSDLNNIDKPKPIYFSELQVKDQVIYPANDPKSILTKSINKTQKITLNHKQFPFYLRFSSIDYRPYKNVKFAYKLIPDSYRKTPHQEYAWNFLNDPEIQLLNLPAGDYRLLINGFSRGLEWDSNPVEINFSILPPWWATWWAYILYALTLGSIIVFIYRTQLSRKLAIAENNRLQEVDALKNSLYTNITHEFRTPLTVILGTTHLLKEKNNITEESTKSFKIIERNSQKLLRLVNEMLDLAKLESAHLTLEPVQADIVSYIKYMTESFESLAEEKNIQLNFYSEIDKLLMDYDPDKIATIMSNLLSNAIKFTAKKAKIFVHLKSLDKNDHQYLYIKVKDEGYGIPKEDIQHVFNKFYQTAHTRQITSEGSGIGLALTKELVDLMKGTITIHSTINVGSEFVIFIPISNEAPFAQETPKFRLPNEKKPIETPELDTEPIDQSDKALVLIIEDNYDVANYLRNCLSGKYATIHAENGKIGVDKAYELIPDIIISDVMMPEKDGFEVTQELKTDYRTDHIPIIILTAKVESKDKIRAYSHGADAYLSKPFLKEELLTRVEQLIKLRQKMSKKFSGSDLDNFLQKKFVEPETKFLQKAIKILNENMNKPNFQSNELAFKLHMSKSQLYRKIKAITGQSIAIFIRSVRLQRGRQLLKSTNKTIAEIGYECGFNDPSWFSKVFKDAYGFSPSDLRK